MAKAKPVVSGNKAPSTTISSCNRLSIFNGKHIDIYRVRDGPQNDRTNRHINIYNSGGSQEPSESNINNTQTSPGPHRDNIFIDLTPLRLEQEIQKKEEQEE